MAINTKIVQYFEDAMNSKRPIRMTIGQFRFDDVEVVHLVGHSQKLSKIESIHIGLSVADDSVMTNDLRGTARDGCSVPVLVDYDEIVTAHITDVFQGGNGIMFTMMFQQETHPDNLRHEREEERRLRKTQQEQGIPTFIQKSIRHEERYE